MTALTCRQCGKRFTPAFRAGRDSVRRQQSSRPRAVIEAQFCSGKCRTANYRWRHKQGLSAVTEMGAGPGVRSAVTVGLQDIENTRGLLTNLEGARPENPPLRAVIEVEVFAPHVWEGRVNSDGAPIQVSRLRAYALREMSEQK